MLVRPAGMRESIDEFTVRTNARKRLCSLGCDAKTVAPCVAGLHGARRGAVHVAVGALGEMAGAGLPQGGQGALRNQSTRAHARHASLPRTANMCQHRDHRSVSLCCLAGPGLGRDGRAWAESAAGLRMSLGSTTLL